MPILRLDKVCLSFGLQPLLDQVDLQIRRGERVCLVGRNGEGKSSLLRLITGALVADQGDVWVRPGTRVASLAQEVASPGGAATVGRIVLDGVDRAQFPDDWQAQLQADQILARLNLDAAAVVSELSGGWHRRVMLGQALAAMPDLLLLDEPTNHLDVETIVWLENMMLDFEGALLFISHDRAFVRRLASRIVELDRGVLRSWPGSYDDYRRLKQDALGTEAKHSALFDKKLAQEEVWIRQGVEARRTRNEGRVRALEQLRLERRGRRARIDMVQMRAQEGPASGKLVFEASGVTYGFIKPLGGQSPLIVNFSARIMRGDRIGIIGPNGAGKTTLIKLLTGEIEPTQGSIRRGTRLLPVYFDQRREQLNEQASIMDNVTGGSGDTVTIDGKPRHVAGYLRDFLFPPQRLHAPVSMLSGGERNRLLLARLFARPSNLLIMDEPTNDLDAETLELLEELVGDYAGTLLLVSHDRAFLDNVVTSTLVFEGEGQVSEYVGGYSDWLRQRKSAAAERTPSAPRASSARSAPRASAAPAPRAAQARRLSYGEQRELAGLPDAIHGLEAEQTRLQTLIATPLIFRDQPETSAAALKRLESLEAELAMAYARWDSLESSGAVQVLPNGAGARPG